jgi:hypothetical protein
MNNPNGTDRTPRPGAALRRLDNRPFNAALKSVRESVESNYDVADVIREKNGLTVAMMNGVVLRIERAK